MTQILVTCRLLNLLIVLNYLYQASTTALDGLDLCLHNCASSERLSGPIRPPHTKSHPWKIAPFPASTQAFCKLGCQHFYADKPTNVSCLNECDYTYR